MFSKKWVFNYAKNFNKVIVHNGDQSPDIRILNKYKERKIYVFGGYSPQGSGMNQVLCFDPVTNSWGSIIIIYLYI